MKAIGSLLDSVDPQTMSTIKRRRQAPRIGKADLAISTMTFTKEDLETTPPAQRSFHFILGQTANEIAILQSILLPALNASKVGPQPVREVALGTAFFMARLISGRIYEAWKLLNTAENGRLLDDLWATYPEGGSDADILQEANAARDQLNKYFGKTKSPLAQLRNKVAFHVDRSTMDAAYTAMPSNWSLVDFHTVSRGSTFFGAADSVAASAIGTVLGKAPEDAVQTMMNDAVRMSGFMIDFAQAYMLAFAATYLGRDKIQADAVILREVPYVDKHKLSFFMKPSPALLRSRASRERD